VAYDQYDLSREQGQPAELYQFTRSPGVYYYTNVDVNVAALGQTWVSQPITRPGLAESLDPSTTSVTLTVPRELPAIQAYFIAPPPNPVTLRIMQVHLTDPERGAEVVWIGRVTNVKWSGASAEVYCESLFTSLKRMGLRRLHGRSCPHTWADPQTCGKARSGPATVWDPAINGTRAGRWADTFATNLTVFRLLNSTTLQTFPDPANKPAGWYNGGWIEYLAYGVKNTVGVVWHNIVGGLVLLELQYAPVGIDYGMGVRLYPNCDHSMTTCNNKFGNSLNNGAQPFIPYKNPFNMAFIYDK
jgi:hypothetical protein